MLVRCTECGHAAPYREGARFCAACSAPRAMPACTRCKRENFELDRFCTFCAAPLPGLGRRPGAGEGLAHEVPAPGAPEELLLLAADARRRAEEAAHAPPPVTKRHLGQDDIDALFEQGS